MKKFSVRLQIAAALAALSCWFSASLSAQTPAEPWVQLLALDKLTPETAQMPTAKLRGMGKFPRKTFERNWDNWLLLDATAREAGEKFLAANGNCAALLAAAADYCDFPQPVRTAIISESRTNSHTLLFNAIAAIHDTANVPLTTKEQKQLQAELQIIPEDTARQAALILQAVPSALQLRDLALAPVGGPEKYPLLYECAKRLAINYSIRPETRTLLEKIDLNKLISGSMILAQALDKAIDMPIEMPKTAEKFSFRHQTPLGLIAISGTADDTYPAEDYLLILDTGGNDVYHDGATANNAAHPVSIILDLDGNDKYESEGMAFGVGLLGFGMLVDCDGNDAYKAVSGLGASGVGVGLLMDRAGNDTYSVNRYGEAAATVGLAVLNDMQGDDRYYCIHAAQAMAQVKSCAVLIDASGNDVYEAEDTAITQPSPQSPKHNASLSQGCAFGRRANPGDGYSLAGGVAVLVDGSGDDSYSAGVFGQGVAYWYGLGMLIDRNGNDRYTGPWYNQGASAHYAVAALLDLAGNDSYVSTMNQSQGHGRDYSTGLLHDVGGNDVIENRGNAVGNSNMNGVGLFWKQNGDAEFKCPATTPGSTGESRPEDFGLGLFMAENGVFKFADDPVVKPDSHWVRPVNPKWPNNHGIGITRSTHGK